MDYSFLMHIIIIILLLFILFTILISCRCPETRYVSTDRHYPRRYYYERFTNKEDEDVDVNESDVKPKKVEKVEKMTEEHISDKSKLNQFEKSVLEGLTNGSMKSEDLTKLIKSEKFTADNLEKIINHVETFKGGFGA
jgi:hypothetical protein